MVAFKIAAFGGMVPAVDDRLLPDNSASRLQNAWLYSGRLEGIRQATKVWTAPNDSVKRVFRVPVDYVDKEHIASGSHWFGFNRPDTDVIKAPVLDDSFKRYYFADDENKPKYNTLERMIAGQAPYLLGVPYPTVAPSVVPGATGGMFPASRGGFRVSGIAAALNYVPAAGPSTPTIKVVPAEYTITGSPRTQFKIVRKVSGHKNYIFGCDSGSYEFTVQPNTVLVGQFNIPNPDQNAPGTEGLAVTRAYVYTWVSAFGEEGAPSPATIVTGSQDGKWYIYLAAPTATDLADRNLTKTRIYRTVTSAAGVATYYLVEELAITSLNYMDQVADETVAANNQLESTYWTPPPSDMKGMVAMPNGIVAGFRGNEVWFCEPYRPHAWPVSYIIQTEYDIVGLGVTGQSLAILTESQPYVATGSTPANMTSAKVAAYEPCLSRGSIVSSPQGVFYVSPNGLIMIAPGMIQNLTEKMFSRDKWHSMFTLDKIRAARLGTSGYYFWGNVRPGMFQENAFEPTAFEISDYTGAYTGALIELSDSRVAVSLLYDADPVTNVTTDVWTGEILVQRGQDVYMIDVADTTRPFSTYTWRSKIFQPSDKKNLEAMKIFFDMTTGATSYGTVRAFANGTQVMERPITMSGQLIRMPSGFKADYWQLEIESTVPIWSIEAATSAKELRGV